MNERTTNIMDGNTFAVCDGRGDIDASPVYPTGLFSFDTRFLSTWVLTINGERLNALSSDDLQYFEQRYFLVPGEPTHYIDAKMSIIRHQPIDGGFCEDLIVLNHRTESCDFLLRMNMGADFADLFEIKDVRQKAGRTSAEIADNNLRFTYQRGTFIRETVISSSVPARVDEQGMSFQVHIEPRGEWTIRLQVHPLVRAARGRDIREVLKATQLRAKPELRRDLAGWLGRAPKLTSDWDVLDRAYRRSLIDLAALRYVPLADPSALPTAGLPWFMTLFGRDSIFICLQTLPFVPELALPVLRVLSLMQGSRLQDFRDEEPGKILHEYRYGETGAFEEQPHTPYFGSADATPLFVILLDEYERWSGDVETVRNLEHEARAALN